jgi:hypothetical protein
VSHLLSWPPQNLVEKNFMSWQAQYRVTFITSTALKTWRPKISRRAFTDAIFNPASSIG